MAAKKVGALIKDARTQAELTQEQLAERVDISVAFVGHIERGTKIPSVATLYRISRALRCLMNDFFDENF